MAKGLFPRRFQAGPRTLVATTAIAVILGSVAMHLYGGDRTSLLYFFFLPVTAASVILGKKIGTALAGFAVFAVVLPPAIVSPDSFVAEFVPSGTRMAMLVTWTLFLLSVAWMVGLISERGGSLALTRGLGETAIRAIERERRRTGQDIHDGIAQYAAAALMEIAVLDDLAAGSEPRVRQQIERANQSLGSLVTEARAMVGSLRPPALGPTEFASTLLLLVEAFELRTGVLCQLEVEGDFAFHSDSMRICVYRVTQEALANIERHAEATRVDVWARASKGYVNLVVRDNGNGFECDSNGNGQGDGHFGLLGMQERVSYLGGRLTIRSAPGEGTILAAHVPGYRGGNGLRSG